MGKKLERNFVQPASLDGVSNAREGRTQWKQIWITTPIVLVPLNLWSMAGVPEWQEMDGRPRQDIGGGDDYWPSSFSIATYYKS